MDIENYLLDVMRGKRRFFLLEALLAFCSLFYQLAIKIRHIGYDRKIFPSSALNVPVLSVGNVVAGGTGKTPIVAFFAEKLTPYCKVAILTRGVGSEVEKSKKICCLSNGEGPLFNSDYSGDEPYLLASKTDSAIWVGIDRIKSGMAAIKEGAECLLLDDGMQHRRLHRDFEVVVIDAQDPFSNERFLPYGFLRDSLKRLKLATLVILTHCADEKVYRQAKRIVGQYTQAPIVATKVIVENKEKFAPQKVGVFCGIGNPLRFLQTVRDLNQEIVDTLILKDHAAANRQELESFANRCSEKGANLLLCTEKDAVKLLDPLLLSLKIVPVKMQIKILSGEEHLDALLNRIREKIRK